MSEPDKKRRLPILQNKSAEEAEDESLPRPPWHWSGIGVVAIFLVWLPLAAVITYSTAPKSNEAGSFELANAIAMIALHWIGFLVAAFAGGFLVGKFGTTAGPKEGAVSGFVTAALAVALAASSSGPKTSLSTWMALLAVVGGSGAISAMLGAKVGVKRRTT